MSSHVAHRQRTCWKKEASAILQVMERLNDDFDRAVRRHRRGARAGSFSPA